MPDERGLGRFGRHHAIVLHGKEHFGFDMRAYAETTVQQCLNQT